MHMKAESIEQDLSKDSYTLLEYIDSGALVFTAEGKLLYMNQVAIDECQIKGIKQVVHINDLFVEQTVRQIERGIAHLIVEGTSVRFTVTGSRGDEPALKTMGLLSKVGATAVFILILEKRPYVHSDSGGNFMNAVVQIKEIERKRIAMDLHDSLGPDLASVKLLLGALCDCPVEKLSDYRHVLHDSMETLDRAIDKIRAICSDLTPSTLENKGLEGALLETVERARYHRQVNFKMVGRDFAHLVTRDAEVVVFMIVREFINNSLKHSSCKCINVSVRLKKNSLGLEVSDDGCGFLPSDSKNGSGNGLQNMRTRVKQLKGSYLLDTRVGAGTKLTIELPYSVPNS